MALGHASELIGAMRGPENPKDETIAATPMFSGDLKLTVALAHFPRGAHWTDEAPQRLTFLMALHLSLLRR